MFERLLRKWSLQDELPINANMVVAISYGATATRLTPVSEQVAVEAARISNRYFEIPIYWGSFSKNPMPTLRVEEEKKTSFPSIPFDVCRQSEQYY